MAYDEHLANRIRTQLHNQISIAPYITEKRMFDGLAFMFHGHMFAGVTGFALMARVGKPQYDEALQREYARPMDFTGKPLTGYVFVDEPGIVHDGDLRNWLCLCLDFVASLPPKKTASNKFN